MAGTLDKEHLRLIAEEIRCSPRQVDAAVELMAEGATVAFVARYRKEATGGLDDDQLEVLAKRRTYFLDLVQRRGSILKSIEEQGKLTEPLSAALHRATTKQELEDLYLPYKKKRRTKAEVARERGLEPLAATLLQHRRSAQLEPRQAAHAFVSADRDVPDAATALEGARHIIAEKIAEHATNRASLRQVLKRHGMLRVRVIKSKEAEGQTYRDYFEHDEPARSVASHRLLAILRGEKEKVLRVTVVVDDDRQITDLVRRVGADPSTRCGEEVAEAVRDGYKRLMRPSLTTEVRAAMLQRAEAEAIAVFRANLGALLLQSPLGQLPVMGLDPGYRTGCKLAVVDPTGKVLDTAVIYPVPPRSDVEGAARKVTSLIRRHGVKAVAVGNGTASRETEQFAATAVKDSGLDGVIVVIVPETGASVYSASAIAREELPGMDVTLRGAVSIARRLQDPLAELVKIEPRSLGVGQYQHDVNAVRLGEELDLTVEAAVNRVGVELNSASASLLHRVSGLSERLARNIVRHRDDTTPFNDRKQLMKVKGIGAGTFEQAAGFLRIRGGRHPLDDTGVHPERYGLVEAMARQLGVKLDELVGNPSLVARLDFTDFLDEAGGVGRFTLDDIRDELQQPGRDPRPEFEAPTWREDVTSIDDLTEGMILEGRVSNVANFGAFVDIGVKRDGMVHVSQLTRRWVDDPRKVVQVGQVVKVQVLEVDHDRGRISLSMKSLEQ